MLDSFPEQLRQDLRNLRMSGFGEIFLQLCRDDAHKDELPEDIFYHAVEEALRRKKERLINAAIKDANFRYPQASIADIRDVKTRGININDIKRIADTNWRQTPYNVHLLAAAGTGKSYIACAIGIQACFNGFSVAYWETDKLLQKLAALWPSAENSAVTIGLDTAYAKLMRKLINVDLLILDDFCTFSIDLTGQENLSRIIMERDNRLPTMISSQSSAAYWLKSMPNQVNADSMINRINNGRSIQLGDFDMRKKTTQEAINQLS